MGRDTIFISLSKTQSTQRVCEVLIALVHLFEDNGFRILFKKYTPRLLSYVCVFFFYSISMIGSIHYLNDDLVH